MAKVIIENSPAILFRRSAGEDRRLVYVSDNVRQLGYTAEEFLSAKIHFRDIVHPEDLERVGREIEGYAEKDVEEYTQVYRFINKSGDVQWVEDQTSVVRDADGNKTHNQDILWISPSANWSKKSWEKVKKNLGELSKPPARAFS